MASGIASAIRVSAIFRGGQVTENRQGRTRRADALPLAVLLLKLGGIGQREHNDLFTGDGTDIVMHAANFHAGRFMNE